MFFVVTKVDIAPEHVLKHTLATLSGILKKPGVRCAARGGGPWAGTARPRMDFLHARAAKSGMPQPPACRPRCGLPATRCRSKRPFLVRSQDDVLSCAKHMQVGRCF